MPTENPHLSLAMNEASSLTELVIQILSAKPLVEARADLARGLGALRLDSLRVHCQSLEQDPAENSTRYLAVDVLDLGKVTPVLFQWSPAATEITLGRFQNQLVSHRIHTGAGEVELRVFPFASKDHDNLRIFAQDVAPVFLPRPQRAAPAIAAGNRHPEISLPAVFDAYRAILEKLNVNMASTVQLSATREMTTDAAVAERDGENPTAIGHTRVSIQHLYHAGLWAAIRGGWREGYTAEADHFIVSGNTPEEVRRSVEMVKEAIRHAVGYTKFTTDTSRMFELRADPRHPKAWSDALAAEKFENLFTEKERKWILSEFSQPFRIEGVSYDLKREEILRLAVKFGESLKLNEELFDEIKSVKANTGPSADFDFEPSLDEAETLTTAKELLFYMHWLKARGRPAQLVPPNLGFKKRQAYPSAMTTTAEGGIGLEDYCHHKMWPELVPRAAREFGGRPIDELKARVAELAAVARYFDGTLSIHSGSGKQAEVLDAIGKATAGRVNYKISGELQLQLLDVLSEQPAGSTWRKLFERMVNRARKFAAAGAFGAESELAEQYVKKGLEFSLGDSSRGRVDGNLFLVFWVGNIVGSRDVDAPDGDTRFFKEKLDELPEDLLAEVRRRNARYVVWLAEHLRS
ncbi:MAG: tagaturonate epimerase family protein [Terriglobia bacterium]